MMMAPEMADTAWAKDFIARLLASTGNRGLLSICSSRQSCFPDEPGKDKSARLPGSACQFLYLGMAVWRSGSRQQWSRPTKLKPRWNLHLWGDEDWLRCRSEAHPNVTEGRTGTAA